MSDKALKSRYSIAVFAVRVGLIALFVPLIGLLIEIVAAHGHPDAVASQFLKSPIFVSAAATPFIVAFITYFWALRQTYGHGAEKNRESGMSRQKRSGAPDIAFSPLEVESSIQRAIDAMHEGFLLCDRLGRVRLFNARALKILDLTPQQIRGLSSMPPNWSVVYDDGVKTQKFDSLIRKTLLSGGAQGAILMRVQTDGRRPRWAMFACEPIELDQDGLPLYVVATMVDVTDQRDAYSKLQDYTVRLEARTSELEQENGILSALATVDSLTGLKNYRAFRERLTTDLHNSSTLKRRVGLLLLDLDNFKSYNDRYGHLVGDEILRSVGAAIQSNVREVDMAARYGGEEFAIVIPDATEQTLELAAERVRKAVEGRSWEYGPVTVSIGGAIGDEFTGTTDKLIVEADQALYRSKSSGKNCVTLFGYAEAAI